MLFRTLYYWFNSFRSCSVESDLENFASKLWSFSHLCRWASPHSGKRFLPVLCCQEHGVNFLHQWLLNRFLFFSEIKSSWIPILRTRRVSRLYDGSASEVSYTSAAASPFVYRTRNPTLRTFAYHTDEDGWFSILSTALVRAFDNCWVRSNSPTNYMKSGLAPWFRSLGNFVCCWRL